MEDSNEENEYGGTPENTSNEEEEDLDRYTKYWWNGVWLFISSNENLEMFLYHHELDVLEANEVSIKEILKILN